MPPRRWSWSTALNPKLLRPYAVRPLAERMKRTGPSGGVPKPRERLNRPLTQEEIKTWMLQERFPPPWGKPFEDEFTAILTGQGFEKVRCECYDTHPVMEVHMRWGKWQRQPEIKVNRLLRKLLKELNCKVPNGCVNLELRPDRVGASIVVELP